jgi:hypothetical protein
MHTKTYTLILLCTLLAGNAYGGAEITGGVSAIASGPGESAGQSTVSCYGGDPSLVLAVTSTSSLYGPGSISDEKTGSQNISLSLGGYSFSLGYSGVVGSSLTLLSQGSGSASSFVGVSTSGISTGQGSYDIFGSADLYTGGYLSGEGVAESSATGSSHYDVIKIGTPSEVWGELSGSSSMTLVGLSSDSLASTEGTVNGLHTGSRSIQTIRGGQMATSESRITAYASAANNARANVSASGWTYGGSWDQSINYEKIRLQNENTASSAFGNLQGYVEANGYMDAADISAIVESSVSKVKDADSLELAASGGVGTYAASTQSSSSGRAYAEVIGKNSSWGSVSRTIDGRTSLEWGNLDRINSTALTNVPASSVSFGKILLTTKYYLSGSQASAEGNMSIETLAEASKNKSAIASTFIGYKGDGTMWSSDSVMLNLAKFVGGPSSEFNLDHFSFVNPAAPLAVTRAIVGNALVSVEPHGNATLEQPFRVNTADDPNVAWSRTEGAYTQTHT